MLYLGDHDPSGIDMSRDVLERLHLFTEGTETELDRLALNIAQVKKMRIPENPTKLTDSRAKQYVKNFGMSCWELDAIEPRQMAELVRSKVSTIRDVSIWNKDFKRLEAMRAELSRFADDYEERERE